MVIVSKGIGKSVFSSSSPMKIQTYIYIYIHIYTWASLDCKPRAKSAVAVIDTSCSHQAWEFLNKSMLYPGNILQPLLVDTSFQDVPTLLGFVGSRRVRWYPHPPVAIVTKKRARGQASNQGYSDPFLRYWLFVCHSPKCFLDVVSINQMLGRNFRSGRGY